MHGGSWLIYLIFLKNNCRRFLCPSLCFTIGLFVVVATAFRRQMAAEMNRAQLASGMAEKLKQHEERARCETASSLVARDGVSGTGTPRAV